MEEARAPKNTNNSRINTMNRLGSSNPKRRQRRSRRMSAPSGARCSAPPEDASGRLAREATAQSLFGTPALREKPPIEQYGDGREAALELLAKHGHSVHCFRGIVDVYLEHHEIAALRGGRR